MSGIRSAGPSSKTRRPGAPPAYNPPVMRNAAVLLALALVAGCAPPPYTADNNIGMVQESLFEEAAAVLAREGVEVQRGATYGTLTGIRVSYGDSFWATKVLLQWRRTKDPGAFITREEFTMGPENP